MIRTRAAALAITAILATAAVIALRIGVTPVRSTAGQLAKRQAPAVVDPVFEALAAHEARLGARRESDRAATQPRRDPFRFRQPLATQPSGPPRAGAPALSTRSADPANPRPLLSLIGIAEDRVAGAPIRTAIISTAERLHLLKEGERFEQRFEILRISTHDVQVRDWAAETTFVLTLR